MGGFPERPDYSFWPDLKRLGRAALHYVTGPHQLSPISDHEFKLNHLPVGDSEAIEVETETYQGQLFNADSLYPGEPTQPISLEAIRAELYGHPFEGRTTDIRGQ